MSNIDIRNLKNVTQVGVDTEAPVATSTTVIGTVQPTIQNPFAVGYVATSTSVDLPNGTSLNLPNLTQDDVQQVNALFGNMSDENLTKVHKASQRLAKALFAAVSQDNSDSTSTSFGGFAAVGGSGSGAAASLTNSVASGGGGAGAGTSDSDDSSNATDAVTQQVDNLTSSYYQTLSQTQMNVQPEDGADDDDSDDDSDDDKNSWGTTSQIPQMQNVQNLSATPALQLIQSTPQASVSTASVGSSGQAATVAGVGMNRAAATTTQASAITGATPASTLAGALQSATVTQAASTASGVTGGISSTENKLLSPSSPNQAPVVSSGTPEVYSAAANAVQVYQQGASAAATVTGTSASSGSLDYDGSVNAVTYMGIIGLQNQLGAYAQQTQTQLNQLNQSRTEYEDVNTAVANWPAGQTTQHFDWTTFDSNGRATQHSADLTYDQATTLKQNLEDQVNGMSDTNQMQQLQLQNLTQNYAQAINTMSNLLKMNFDTVKAVINNIRA